MSSSVFGLVYYVPLYFSKYCRNCNTEITFCEIIEIRSHPGILLSYLALHRGILCSQQSKKIFSSLAAEALPKTEKTSKISRYIVVYVSWRKKEKMLKII